MDWNHDGKIDGKDSAIFHEVIDKKSNNSSANGAASGGGNGGNSSKFEITQLGGIVLGLLFFVIIAFIFMGSGFKAIWNTIEIGFVVFLVAQWLDG